MDNNYKVNSLYSQLSANIKGIFYSWSDNNMNAMMDNLYEATFNCTHLKEESYSIEDLGAKLNKLLSVLDDIKNWIENNSIENNISFAIMELNKLGFKLN